MSLVSWGFSFMATQPIADAWRIRLTVSASAVAAFESVLDQLAEAVLCFEIDEGPDKGQWILDGVCREVPDRAQLAGLMAVAAAAAGEAEPRVAVERLGARDWVSENLTAFPPMEVGPFFVHGSHFAGVVPAARIPLLIDAGTAFGSGEHQSTRGCLLALADLARARAVRRPLDMGCGSGILALAIAKLWRVPVTAADIDPVAARVTTINAGLNGVPGWVHAFTSDGFKSRAIRNKAPFDLIVANILARPLASMAAAAAAALASGGTLILSGLLERQGPQIISAFRSQGLRLERRIVIEPWITLVLRK